MHVSIPSKLLWTAILSSVLAQRQTQEEAAADARRIILNESEGTLLSVYQEGVAPSEELVGVPIGIMEYFADCSDNGSPTILMLDIAPATRNLKAGSKLTLSLRDHSYDAPLQHARMYLVADPEHITSKHEQKRLEQCYLSRHPDAEVVAPGRDVHASSFYTLNIEELYYFGGFGNVSYIGFIPIDLYEKSTPKAAKMAIQFQG